MGEQGCGDNGAGLATSARLVVKDTGWGSAEELTVSYLLVLVLSGRHIQLKGLLDQPSLPLPLALRAVRREGGAVVLVSSGTRQQSQEHGSRQQQPVGRQDHIHQQHLLPVDDQPVVRVD